ncbi:MAG: lytic transglycosylase domain-containing protein [Pseudomonadota bacterium]
MKRAYIACAAGILTASLSIEAAFAGLSEAMSAVRAEDWGIAKSEARADGATAVAIVEWHRLRARDGTFEEYQSFLTAYADWPGLPLLQRRGEATIPPSAEARDVLAYFLKNEPATAEGAMRLAQAFDDLGERSAAEAEAIRAWTKMTLSAQQESVMLARYGPALADHHIARIDNLLWRHRFSEAERMRGRVPEAWRSLLAARVALRRDQPGVDGFIQAVPADLRGHPGLAFERMEWRARKGRTDGVVEIMLSASARADGLGRPEAWAKRRRPLARQMMRAGRSQEAYLLASQHQLERGVDFADLEWLAGYIALRELNRPQQALVHFQRFRSGVKSTISLGRAGYWEGRAYEAMDQPLQAAAAYAFGAEFQTSFYGQLAAEKAGLPMDGRLTGAEAFAVPADAAFLQSDVYHAGKLLHEAGELELAARFFAHMAESMDRAEAGQLAVAVSGLGSAYYPLRVAKRVSTAGEMLHGPLFPMMEISVAGREGVSPELALAIARRESEFNHRVISPAGARGLMQVMPGTAEETARKLGVSYSRSRLTGDAEYNALLGTAYLSQLRRRFGGATILVAAGYNAGPGRPPRWIEAYGDPRNGRTDPVDWIEHIPFRETRNYVMRVMESLAPYRAQLSGQTSSWTLSQELSAS